jgi:hypothetical protein
MGMLCQPVNILQDIVIPPPPSFVTEFLRKLGTAVNVLHVCRLLEDFSHLESFDTILYTDAFDHLASTGSNVRVGYAHRSGRHLSLHLGLVIRSSFHASGLTITKPSSWGKEAS